MNNVTAKEAQKMVEDGAQVIDVRTAAEFAEGHIPNAKNIGFNDDFFTERVRGLDANGTYIINCQSGGRSARATSLMQELGLKNVFNLEGGIIAWKREGLPVV